MKSPGLYETRRRILALLEKLAEELDAIIYLFGSYARGDHLIESDVDIVVVSEKFQGLAIHERVELVRLKLPDTISFDIIPLTPKEFEGRMVTAFFRDISRYWIRIEPRKRKSPG
jgi:predicted nucleotidyltransferase